MPELPEVETIRRELDARLIGARVTSVRVERPDYVCGEVRPSALLCGTCLVRLTRRGKQLAIHGDNGRVVCVHLGMSGQLLLRARGERTDAPTHVHVAWSLAGGGADAWSGRLLLRDPRRFGGVWTFPDAGDLDTRWRQLGPDALTVRGADLDTRLRESRAPVKARLLDQGVVAGLGNIYADEALFAARLDPRLPCASVGPADFARLATSIRRILRRAVAAGGTTFSDYRRPDGRPGDFQRRHLVYGRGGQPCLRCRTVLEQATVAQRTTVWCPTCQAGP